MFNTCFKNQVVVRYDEHKEHHKSRYHFYKHILTYYYPITIKSYLKYEVRYFIPRYYSKYKLNMIIWYIKLRIWSKTHLSI